MTMRPRHFDHAAARDVPPVLKLDDRACLDADPEILFPPVNVRPDEARAVCRRCPHTVACLEWAVETGQAHGVWGGTSAYERAALIEQRKAESA